MTRRPHILVQRARIDATVGKRLDRQRDRERAGPAALEQRNRRLVGKADAQRKFGLVQAKFAAQRFNGEWGFHAA